MEGSRFKKYTAHTTCLEFLKLYVYEFSPAKGVGAKKINSNISKL